MDPALPLQGKKILVTRGKDQALSFSEKIRASGGVPIEIPLIAFQTPQNQEPVQSALLQLATFDWVVLTSQNGVEFFFEAAEELHISNFPKIAAVGKKTEKAVRAKGQDVALVPGDFVAEGLLAELLPLIKKGDRILIPRGNLARPVIKEGLQSAGALVCDIIVYETVINEKGRAELKSLLMSRQLDAVTFTSSSTVKNFLALTKGMNLKDVLKDVIVACIGTITEKTARQAGLPVTVCPKEFTVDAMLEEIIGYINTGGGKENV